MHSLIELKPTNKQKSVLDGLFFGPEKLMSNIYKEKPKFHTDFDISLYLLSNKNDLYPGVDSKLWEYCIEFLKYFIYRYVDFPDLTDLTLKAIPGCSISDNCKIYFPFDGLRLVPVNSHRLTNEVNRWRSENLRYTNGFSVCKVGSKYMCEIPLEEVGFLRGAIKDKYHPCSKPVERKKSINSRLVPNKNRCGSGRKPSAVREIKYSLDQIFEKMLQKEVALSKSYSRVDFSSLQGKSVQGGAIESGKR